VLLPLPYGVYLAHQLLPLLQQRLLLLADGDAAIFVKILDESSRAFSQQILFSLFVALSAASKRQLKRE
jgi:hypothetical protein